MRQNHLHVLLVCLCLLSHGAHAFHRIVVTFHDYHACDHAAPFRQGSCAGVVKCYGRRLVLSVDGCASEVLPHVQTPDTLTDEQSLMFLHKWVRLKVGDAASIASVEADEELFVSTADAVQDASSMVYTQAESVHATDEREDGVNGTMGSTGSGSSSSSYQWNLDMLNIWQTWSRLGTYGEGGTVAVLDSGIAESALAAFGGRVLEGYDFITDGDLSMDGDGRDEDYHDPGDTCDTGDVQQKWHGTKVASVLAANYSGFLGVAPQAFVMPVRVLGKCGRGFASDVADAIVWAAGGEIQGLNATAQESDVGIILMAFAGVGTCPSYMQTAVDLALARNIVLLAAAGNNPLADALEHFPANCRGVLSVGAIDDKGNRSSYSSTGADLFMPGGDHLYMIQCIGADPSRVEGCMGTSMAVPHAGGLYALRTSSISRHPNLTADSDDGMMQWSALLTSLRPTSESSAAVPPIHSDWNTSTVSAATTRTINMDEIGVSNTPFGFRIASIGNRGINNQWDTIHFTTNNMQGLDFYWCFPNTRAWDLRVGPVNGGITISRQCGAGCCEGGSMPTSTSFPYTLTMNLITYTYSGSTTEGYLRWQLGTCRAGFALVNGICSTCCGAGRYNLAGTCTSCPANTYSDACGSSCISCPTNFISAMGSRNVSQCIINCPNGTYVQSPTQCALCPAGTFSAAINASNISTCELCPPGTYSQAGSARCIRCPAGSYAEGSGTPGAANCTSCPAGTASSALGANLSSTCAVCPSGTFSRARSQNCSLCPPGSYQPLDEQESCELCEVGTSSPVQGSTSNETCVPCMPGTHAPRSGMGVCLNCSAGFFSYNESMCEPCPAGFYSAIPGAPSNATCLACSAGSYSSRLGANSSNMCLSCPMGTYSGEPGADSLGDCLPCPAGTSSNRTRQVSVDTCRQCAPGTYAELLGQPSCTLCPVGTFSNETAASNRSTCEQCPAGLNALPGSTFCDVFPICEDGTLTFSYNALNLSVGSSSAWICAILTRGALKCWGSNSDGQLGYGDTLGRLSPPLASIDIGTMPVVQVATSVSSTFALFSNGQIKCWGGIPCSWMPGGSRTKPALTYDSLGSTSYMVRHISAGRAFVCIVIDLTAFNSYGKVKCWGQGYDGELGTGFSQLIGDPSGAQGWVDMGTGVISTVVSCGAVFACALTTNGQVKCWGVNTHGQLGYGDTVNRMSPPTAFVNFGTGVTVKKLVTGSEHACVITNTDSIMCWGQNQDTQLGASIGNFPIKSPINVPLGSGVTAKDISAGYRHTCVVTNSDTVKCWGSGWNGQLGYAQTSLLPAANHPAVNLGTGLTGRQVLASEDATCVITSINQMKCFGRGANGRLGYGDTENIFAPRSDHVNLGTYTTGGIVCSCDSGFSSPNNNTVCRICPNGTYSIKPSTATCTLCPAGTYSPDEGTSYNCTACPAGFYSTALGARTNATCTACPAGTYSEVSGRGLLSQCLRCPNGTFSTEVAVDTRSACQVCPEGTTSNAAGSACVSCPAGTYGLPGTGNCTRCPAGTYSGAVGASSVSTCIPCADGYISTATGATSVATCTACRAGTYTSVPGSTACTLCAAGTFSTQVAAPNISTCQLCALGYFSPAGGVSSCTICPTGTYAAALGTPSSCTQCPAGSFSAATGATTPDTCVLCPMGTYTTAAQSSTCTACAAGRYLPFFGGNSSAQCLQCPAGTFSLASSGNCTLCAAGTYSATVAATSIATCLTCGTGTYSLAGNTSCTQCPAGTASGITRATNLSACVACAAGFYAVAGSQSCTACGAGTFSSTVAATSSATCTQCPAGTASAITGATNLSMCVACAAGFYAVAGSQSCTACGAGTFSSTVAATSSAACTQCRAGTYSSTVAANSIATCLLCPADTFSTVLGAVSNATCSACGSGRFSTEGSSACSNCSAGTFSCKSMVIHVPVRAKSLAAGKFATHTCILDFDGKPRCWGEHATGQLGYGILQQAVRSPGPPVDIGAGVVAKEVVISMYATCILSTTDQVKCWGANSDNRLGFVGGDAHSPPASFINFGTGVTVRQISVGTYHACAILSTGGLRCWGRNSGGQLGYGHTNTMTPPPTTDVNLGTGVVASQVSCGSAHTCMLSTTNKVKCWGVNHYGQLGYGDGVPRNSPPSSFVAVEDAKKISCGDHYTCVVTTSNRAVCWGYGGTYSWDGLGKLGYASSASRNAPQSAITGTPYSNPTVVDIGASTLHTCWLLSTGEVQCWGSNEYGQLGYESTTHRLTPTGIINLGTGNLVKSIGVYSQHTCAQLLDDTIKCWGRNSEGALGLGTFTSMGDNANEMGDFLPRVNLGTTMVSISCTVQSQGQNCQACPSGTFSGPASSACTTCAAGTYSSSPASQLCTSCQPGKFSVQPGATNSSTCMDCHRGTYAQLPAASVCTNCTVGTYSDLAGAFLNSTCVKCPAGTYSQQSGASTCHACPGGSFNTQAGLTTCQTCLMGTASKL